jgi:SPP1 family predicted phage head-tail adaptor
MQQFKYNPNYHTGLFRHRITFQKLQTTTDELGQETKEWVDDISAWAMIKTLKGREYFEVATSMSAKTYRFIIHYREGIDGTMKIKYKNRIFDIEEPPINDDELNKTLTIIAVEKGV